MKHFVIIDENNNFDNFLQDKNVKKYISAKISWSSHLFVILKEKTPEDTISYILLKYGDNLKNTDTLVTDRKPIMYVDYLPEEENKFTKYIYENYRNSKRR